MQSRNKYIEGKRRLRAKPFITAKAILLTFLLSLVAYAGFWFYTDKDGGLVSQKVNMIGEQIFLSFLLIGIIVIAAVCVGSVIGWIRSRSTGSQFMIKDNPATEQKSSVEQLDLHAENREAPLADNAPKSPRSKIHK